MHPFTRNARVIVQAQVLMKQNSVSFVKNVQQLRKHFTVPQRLVLTLVLEIVPYNYKTNICWLNLAQETSLHWRPSAIPSVSYPYTTEPDRAKDPMCQRIAAQ